MFLNRTISIVIGIALVLGVGSIVYMNKQASYLPTETNTTQATESTQVKQSPNTNIISQDDDEEEEEGGNPITPTSNPISVPTTSGGITINQVAEHNSRSSCWSAINGSVYDLTSWIPNHPGGEQTILSLCGIDGSANYNAKHGGGSKPARILGGFKIGTLAS